MVVKRLLEGDCYSYITSPTELFTSCLLAPTHTPP